MMSHHHKGGHNYNLLMANNSFKNVTKSNYLGTRATNQNFI